MNGCGCELHGTTTKVNVNKDATNEQQRKRKGLKLAPECAISGASQKCSYQEEREKQRESEREKRKKSTKPEN